MLYWKSENAFFYWILQMELFVKIQGDILIKPWNFCPFNLFY